MSHHTHFCVSSLFARHLFIGIQDVFSSIQHWLLSVLKGHFHKYIQLNFKATCSFLPFPVRFNSNVKFHLIWVISFAKRNKLC